MRTCLISNKTKILVLTVLHWENFNFYLHLEELGTECKYYIQLCKILTLLNIKCTLDNTKRAHTQSKKWWVPCPSAPSSSAAPEYPVPYSSREQPDVEPCNPVSFQSHVLRQNRVHKLYTDRSICFLFQTD